VDVKEQKVIVRPVLLHGIKKKEVVAALYAKIKKHRLRFTKEEKILFPQFQRFLFPKRKEPLHILTGGRTAGLLVPTCSSGPAYRVC
jgi:hypothetical protein